MGIIEQCNEIRRKGLENEISSLRTQIDGLGENSNGCEKSYGLKTRLYALERLMEEKYAS